MNAILLLAASTLAVVAANHSDLLKIDHSVHWMDFKTNFKKSYRHETEESLRYNVYIDNLNKIKMHNQRYAQGLETFQLGSNSYCDMLHSEFLAKMTGFPGVRSKSNSTRTVFNVFRYTRQLERLITSIPSSVNWTAVPNVVTPVKDQGQCGSCWAFAATGAIEGRHGIKHGNLVTLSEQNLMDCTTAKRYGNAGCDGGWPRAAFQYIWNNHGINTESSYNYKATHGYCAYNATNKAPVNVIGFGNVLSGNEKALQVAVAAGPVAVAVDASAKSFQFYKSGIYSKSNCDSQNLDHAVLVVGYDTMTVNNKSMGYWIVKNSWGVNWGMNGYILMARNANNNCGIATDATFPIVA